MSDHMNGMDLARGYFEEYGLPMLKRDFPQLLPLIAAGLTGSGSECFGYDDEVSRDHDFEPGFCLFLPGEEQVDRRSAFALERAYAKLPKEYGGLKRSLLQPVGGGRRGVLRRADFFLEKTGRSDGMLNAQEWLRVPSQSLAEAVNGELFLDPSGEMTRIRGVLSHYPEDIRRKKLAGHLLLMGQSGQYNYLRTLLHGEQAAAQLAVGAFVHSCISVIFLLNRVYEPYYKWVFRALRSLPLLSLEAELLEYLLTTANDGEMAQEKSAVMEGICADIIDQLQEQELTEAVCMDLEKHAYSVNDHVGDAQIRNLHILAGV